MRMLIAVLAALILLPTASYAGTAGTYDLNNEKMLEAMLAKMKERGLPPERIKMIQKRLSARMKLRRLWMVLTSKGEFKGISQKAGQKEKLGATGTWSKKGNIVTIHSIATKTKKKESIACTVEGKTLICKSGNPRSPAVHFTKR